MNEEQINETRVLQSFLGGYSDVSLEQIRLLPYAIFRDISNCKVEITEDLITVNLISYAGLKGFILRKWYKRKDVERAKFLTKCLLYWAPKGTKNPKVIIRWSS